MSNAPILIEESNRKRFKERFVYEKREKPVWLTKKRRTLWPKVLAVVILVIFEMVAYALMAPYEMPLWKELSVVLLVFTGTCIYSPLMNKR